MPELNWAVFEDLPGAATTNFELIWRAIIQRHYSRHGEFRALAKQPGVEFHLRLVSACDLGEPGQWYGWQCKWYDVPSGRAIGSTRRGKIEKAIAKTEEVVPGVTDWVLCTRHPLTASDQEWYYGLQTGMRLHLWTGTDLEAHLYGPAEPLRSTYFGELVLTPEALAALHTRSVAEVRGRWLPDVHQIVDVERDLRRHLAAPDAWSDLSSVSDRISAGIVAVCAATDQLPPSMEDGMATLCRIAEDLRTSVQQSQVALERGDVEVLRQELADLSQPPTNLSRVLRLLRAGRFEISLDATNLLGDVQAAHRQLLTLSESLGQTLIAVVADAGYGKTQLAAELTAGSEDRAPGILLFGRNLNAGQGLDDLARRVVVHGRSVDTFERLVAAVDAAGQRGGQRIPILIDGLNEAEDPRDWKRPLAALSVALQGYKNVLVVCTLRSAFVREALPEGAVQLTMAGFEHDTIEAVRRYFRYYRIDATDAGIPFRLLNHPLTLRMFCEVTNPGRAKVVGVESMPASLTALFDRYVEQVALRIQELSSRGWRYYESDVVSALSRIGLALWEEGSRSLDFADLRRILNDDGKPWDQSIVRALEHHGILIRVAGEESGPGRESVVYDALAGHLIGEGLLGEHRGRDFDRWLQDEGTQESLFGQTENRHPLAEDIFRSLVGLSPRRRYRDQLWALLEGPARAAALRETALLEAAYLDSDSVSELSELVADPRRGRADLFDRLWITRAARSHPLDAEFLDFVLRRMAMPDRDLRWTEWVRANNQEIIADLERLEERWQNGLRPGDGLRARWVMWTLTSTVRLLRDQATRAMYRFGSVDPEALFALTLESLAVNDPYIPERMLAACYGVAMALWADPASDEFRAALPIFADALVDQMFVPDAPHPTRHVLTRDAALGIVALARRVAPECVSEEKHGFLHAPFEHLPSPFSLPEEEVSSSVRDDANAAIRMDFGNYTIGQLIPGRRNYDYDDPTYREVREQIDFRIVELGYSRSRFETIDGSIEEGAWRAKRHSKPKIDRYGKKYAWISYFEMYGVRSDRRTLPEGRAGQRSSDVDIDPSFPDPPLSWTPPLHDTFEGAPTEARAWIADGPVPCHDDLLKVDVVDERRGPWILLDGHVEESSQADDRRIFTFLRGVLVPSGNVASFLAEFDASDQSYITHIPDPRDDHYTFAGEIPWSPRFGIELRDEEGRAEPDGREAFVRHDGTRWLPGIAVEVPTYRFSWESYHSPLNQVSGIVVPSPALCERLHLSNRRGEWDLYDTLGQPASLYREFRSDADTFGSHLTYIRADILKQYLAEKEESLVWVWWGERDFHHRTRHALNEELRDLYSDDRQKFRSKVVWSADS